MENQVSAPKNRKRNITLVVLGIIGSLAALLFVCLIGIFFINPFNVLDRISGRTDLVAQVMPADTQLYASINLLNVDRERLQAIQTAFEKATANTDLDLEDAQSEYDDFWVTFEEETGMTLEGDILTWIGQYGGIGVSDVRFNEWGEPEDGNVVIAIEARDLDAADAFLAKAAAEIRAEGETINESTYQDVLVYEIDTERESERWAFARAGNFVLMGNNINSVENAIVAQAGDSLGDTTEFQAITNELPRNRAISMVMTGSGMVDFLKEMQNNVDMNTADLDLDAVQGTGIALSLVDAGIKMDAISMIDLEKMDEAQRQYLIQRDGSALADQLPANTMGFATGDRLDLLWTVLRDSYGKALGESDVDEALQLFEDELGFEIDTLFAQLDGDYALAVTSGGDNMLAQEFEMDLGVAMLVESSQTDQLNNIINDINQKVEEQQLSVVQSETAGATFYEIGDGTDAFITYGTNDRLMFIGTSKNDLQPFLTADGTLGNDATYQATWAAFDSDMTPVFYVDLATVLTSMEQGMEGSELEYFQEDTAYLKPITRIAHASNSGNTSIQRQTMILFIETE